MWSNQSGQKERGNTDIVEVGQGLSGDGRALPVDELGGVPHGPPGLAELKTPKISDRASGATGWRGGSRGGRDQKFLISIENHATRRTHCVSVHGGQEAYLPHAEQVSVDSSAVALQRDGHDGECGAGEEAQEDDGEHSRVAHSKRSSTDKRMILLLRHARDHLQCDCSRKGGEGRREKVPE